MRAFVFKCTTRPFLQAATADSSGARLPACPDGRWTVAGDLDLDAPAAAPRRAIDTTAVKDSINRLGYYVFGGTGAFR
jgi:hypothetical protein